MKIKSTLEMTSSLSIDDIFNQINPSIIAYKSSLSVRLVDYEQEKDRIKKILYDIIENESKYGQTKCYFDFDSYTSHKLTEYFKNDLKEQGFMIKKPILTHKEPLFRWEKGFSDSTIQIDWNQATHGKAKEMYTITFYVKYGNKVIQRYNEIMRLIENATRLGKFYIIEKQSLYEDQIWYGVTIILKQNDYRVSYDNDSFYIEWSQPSALKYALDSDKYKEAEQEFLALQSQNN